MCQSKENKGSLGKVWYEKEESKDRRETGNKETSKKKKLGIITLEASNTATERAPGKVGQSTQTTTGSPGYIHQNTTTTNNNNNSKKKGLRTDEMIFKHKWAGR